MKSIIIITNNPEVLLKYQNHQIIQKKSAMDVLIQARDLIHLGHKLLNHPLAGSVKPNETPYRSLLLSSHAEKLDYPSLAHIEGAIHKYEQFYQDRPTPVWPEKILEDFQLIDLTLLTSGYDSIV